MGKDSENAIILPAAYALVLFEFFNADHARELMEYHLRRVDAPPAA